MWFSRIALALLFCAPAFGGYVRRSTITFAGATGSTQTNITLVSVTVAMSDLKDVAHGGVIQHATCTHTISGVPCDFIVTDDINCGAGSTTFKWGFETYDGTAGTARIWVIIPSLTTTGITPYVCFGNTAVSTYQGGSTGAEFDSSTSSVWHLPNGTTLGATTPDFSVNANSGAVTNATATTGKIDGAANLSPASAKINTASPSALPTGSAASFTIEGWQNSSVFNSLSVIYGFGNPDSGLDVKGGERYLIEFNNDYYFWGDLDGSHADADWDTGIPFDTDGAWHMWVFVANATTLSFYRDGVLRASTTRPTSWVSVTGAVIRSGFATTWNVTTASLVDEEKIVATERVANWIATEYANQNSPPSMSAPITLGTCTLSLLGVGC